MTSGGLRLVLSFALYYKMNCFCLHSSPFPELAQSLYFSGCHCQVPFSFSGCCNVNCICWGTTSRQQFENDLVCSRDLRFKPTGFLAVFHHQFLETGCRIRRIQQPGSDSGIQDSAVSNWGWKCLCFISCYLGNPEIQLAIHITGSAFLYVMINTITFWHLKT